MSVRHPPSVRKLPPIPVEVSQIVTNKSCLLCVQSQKYALWVTFSPLGLMKRGKAVLHNLRYEVR